MAPERFDELLQLIGVSPKDDRLTFTAEQLAEKLQVDPANFTNRAAELARKHGFPKPLAGFRPLRWSRGAVRRWIEANGDANLAHGLLVVESGDGSVEASRLYLDGLRAQGGL